VASYLDLCDANRTLRAAESKNDNNLRQIFTPVRHKEEKEKKRKEKKERGGKEYRQRDLNDCLNTKLRCHPSDRVTNKK